MPRKKPRPCRTCKFQKVKCDEGWPACHRCVYAGRVCEGYGIWGGGANTYQDGTNSLKTLVKHGATLNCMPVSVNLPNIMPEENGYLEWFFRRSVLKLPGIFGSGFWETVVLQASSNEPAVLHAILALSAVHKDEAINIRKPGRIREDRDKPNRFVMKQYSMAINNLQPHLVAQNKEYLQITLIACLVFVSLEFLAGNQRNGHVHLRNGLKILHQFTSNPSRTKGSIDQHIIEEFTKLELQAQMFVQITGCFPNIQLAVVTKAPATPLETLAQYRRNLDHILKGTFHLTWRRHQVSADHEGSSLSKLQDARLLLREKLIAWHKLLTETITHPHVWPDLKVSFAYRFLSIYHTMVKIMIETSLEIAQESVFYKYASDFQSLIAQAVSLRNALWSIFQSDPLTLPGPDSSPFNSIADTTWIPPLYYTAIKCRSHPLRVHAIKLLKENFHKEGIWDSQLAAKIGQGVMKLEERNFYDDYIVDDSFSISESPVDIDCSLPALPQSYFVNKVEVIFPRLREAKVELKCWRLGVDGTWEVISRNV